MESAGEFLLKESRRRRLKNALIKYCVMSGGILVLMMLALIFFYLLYVVTPIFSSPSVKNVQRYSVPLSSDFQPLAFDTYDNVLFQATQSGILIAQSFPHDRNEATIMGEAHPSFEVASWVANSGEMKGGAFLGVDHSVQFLKPTLKQSTISSKKTNTSLTQTSVLSHQTSASSRSPVQWHSLFEGHSFQDPTFTFSRLVASSFDETQGTVIGKTISGQWKVLRVTSEQDQKSKWTIQADSLPMLPSVVVQWILTPNGHTLYALTAQTIYVVDLSRNQPKLRDTLSMKTPMQFRQMALLSGGESLLTLTNNHQLFRWFETVNQGQRQWVQAQSYRIEKQPIRHILTDQNKKNFYVFYLDGTMSGYYATQNTALFSKGLFASSPNSVLLSNNGQDVWAETDFQWHQFRLKNAYSELSGSSLFQKTWYEHYEQPDYVWQPKSDPENREPKFSLLPLLSGTLKATVIAMIFAIPLSVLGAIYTAYFMSVKVRHIVKPTIELMEALPTVILGFLAGIWLAPIIEMHMIGVISFLILSPMLMLSVGGIWGSLPNYWRHKIPNGFHVALLMPMLILLGWGCLHWGNDLETWLFGQDVIRYVDRELGVGYEQRNALVVGIAMGFAVIPTIFTIAEDAIHSVPNHLVKGSLALGATHWQTLTRVVLLTASPGIFSAIIMGVGRAIGETMIVIMATGNTPIMDWNILHGLRSLAASIAIEMPESDVGSAHYRVLFLGAFFLFLFTFVFNTLAEVIRQRLRDKYRSLS